MSSSGRSDVLVAAVPDDVPLVADVEADGGHDHADEDGDQANNHACKNVNVSLQGKIGNTGHKKNNYENFTLIRIGLA